MHSRTEQRRADRAEEGLASDVLPRIPGPWGEPPDLTVIAPLARTGAIGHAIGGLLNAGAIALAAVFLVRHADVLGGGWPLALLAVLVATFVADFASGLLHWAFDTWFDEGIAPLRRMVMLVREHHMRPARIFRYRLRDEAGLLSWFGLILGAPPLALAVLPEGDPGALRYALAVGAVTVSLEIVFMLEFHKCGHRMRRPRAIRALQRMRLLLSPDDHMRHHSGRHDENYCLITGIADRTLGRLGAFRALERSITTLTGAVPRENDRRWAMRYGRPR
jgi:hypothetical protein